MLLLDQSSLLEWFLKDRQHIITYVKYVHRIDYPEKYSLE